MPSDPQTSKVMQRKIWVGIYFSQSLQRVLFNDDVMNPPLYRSNGSRRMVGTIGAGAEVAVQLEAGNKALTKRTRD